MFGLKKNKSKEIVSLDIKSTSTNYEQYVLEEHINCIITLLFHSMNIYPPHAKLTNPQKSPITIKHLEWFISYKHFKLIQDIFETIKIAKTNKSYFKEIYYNNCIELLFYNLVTIEDGGMSLQQLLKHNGVNPVYFSKTKEWILIIKIKFTMVFIKILGR